MKQARMMRLFGTSGNCFDVAIDHGMFNEKSFLGGIEDMRHAIDVVAQARPDAIQLPPGTAPILQARPGKDRPALVPRTDIANVYGTPLPRVLFSEVIDRAVEQAVRLDAACVVVNLLMLPDEPEVYAACVRNVNRLKPTCEDAGMPLMIEPLVMQPNSGRGGYLVDGDAQKIVTLVRLAREMGADIIKADPTSDPADFHRVVEAARCPVLVRGGGKEDLRAVFDKSAALMRQGAMGMVYGRNIYQHANPSAVVRGLMAIIHQDASGEEAIGVYQQG